MKVILVPEKKRQNHKHYSENRKQYKKRNPKKNQVSFLYSNDDEVKKWVNNQKNQSESLRIAVRYMISTFGSGDLLDAITSIPLSNSGSEPHHKPVNNAHEKLPKKVNKSSKESVLENKPQVPRRNLTGMPKPNLDADVDDFDDNQIDENRPTSKTRDTEDKSQFDYFNGMINGNKKTE